MSKHIWHPMTNLSSAELLNVVEAKGCKIFTADGQEYLDAISSWWLSLHGHCPEKINQRLKEQLDKFSQVVFANCTHSPASKLADKLIELLPDYQKVFFSDNGSCSIEAALKMAVQFWYNQGEKRSKFVSLKHGYHGDTVACMSVADRSVFNAPFHELMFKSFQIDLSEPEELENILREENIAAFIFEPLLQGAGGMLIHSPAQLDQAIAACQKHGVICIADEILTGFYKTGSMFASDQLQNKPDIICLSKALTAGTMPMSVNVVKEKVHQAFISTETKDLFLHAHSYSGNALGCVAALASIEQMQTTEFAEALENLISRQATFKEKLQEYPQVANARHIGLVVAFELHDQNLAYENKIREILQKEFLEKNILIRPIGNTIYILPPVCITNTELELVYSAVIDVINNHK